MVPLAVWVYALVFAFSSLWFAHYLLAALARCRVIGRLGVGLDNIDVPACEARGMAVLRR